MKPLCILPLCIVLLTSFTLGQTSAPPSAPAPPDSGWKHSLVAGLTLSQVGFTDWAQGGENSLSYALNADGKSVDEEMFSEWITAYKFAFGQTRLSNQGLRKSDDVIDISTVFTYKLGVYVNPYASATLKTQFAKGFAYPVPDSSLQVSAFFDPAFLTQSAGVGYQPMKEMKTRLGIGLREVMTKDFNLYSDDPATVEVEKTSVDGGLESVTNIEWQWDDNILFTTQLELFSRFKKMDEIMVRSNTAITGKVNKYISAIFSLQMINEKRITPKTQIKESIALGLSYTLF